MGETKLIMYSLSIDGVHCRYQQTYVINNIHLSVKKGEILALLGSSGCGKTTLLKIIAGLLPVQAGKLSICGRILNSDDTFIASEHRRVGMIFQDYALFPHLTVNENILFGIKDKKNQQDILNEMLALTRLENLGKRYPHELSGGQQQRVAIARTLACKPDILLLDEPFSNIDPQVRQELMIEIRQIIKSLNMTAVFVTHCKEEAYVFADKLALMDKGKVIQEGSAECLYANPVNRYVADFLGGGNYVPIRVQNDYEVDSPLGKLISTETINFPHLYEGEILLRPQQFTLSANRNGNAEVVDRQFLGNMCHYKVKIASYFLDVRSQLMQFMPGEKVNIYTTSHPLVIF